MTSRSTRRTARGSLAGNAAALLLLVLALASAGCSRRAAERAPGAAGADTLANGLPRALVPELDAWVRVWRASVPGFAPESLARTEPVPFPFESPQPGQGMRWAETVRSRALILVPSPDSAYAVDFDRYLDFDSEGGSPDFGREPDSAPMFLDFAHDTLWTIAFCGTSCFYDGAYWVDSRRFALTGAAQTGEDYNGPWQPFLDVHDLRTHARTRWLARTVDDEAFARYQRAYDALLRARLREALQGGQATTSTGMGPTAMR